MLGRPVDVGRQGAEFVPIDDIDAVGKVAGGNLAEPSFNLGDRSNQRPGDGVTKDERQHTAAQRKAHDSPLRCGVGLIARLDAGYHVGLGLVDQLVRETLKTIGQRRSLCDLQFSCFRGTAGADQFQDIRHDIRKPVVLIPKPVKQFYFVLGHELQSVNIVPNLIELTQCA